MNFTKGMRGVVAITDHRNAYRGGKEKQLSELDFQEINSFCQFNEQWFIGRRGETHIVFEANKRYASNEIAPHFTVEFSNRHAAWDMEHQLLKKINGVSFRVVKDCN